MAEAMTSHPLEDYRRELLGRYLGQVDDYRSHVSGLTASAVRTAIKPGEWSPHQLIFHVRAVDQQAYGPRLEQILREDQPTLSDFDESEWMAAHYDPDETPAAILDGWASVRRRYADLLADVPPPGWSRIGRQSYWGERTLQWWVERAIAHAEDHWRQLLGE